MGASLPRLFTMRASALVLLALASVYGDSDPYTVGQVAYGATYGGVVTGIDYGYGHVAGYGAIGNRGFYGKREADSEPYTLGQVALGLPVHNAYATGSPPKIFNNTFPGEYLLVMASYLSSFHYVIRSAPYRSEMRQPALATMLVLQVHATS